MKKYCTKINIKLPFVTKTTGRIQSFRREKENLFSTKWDMIWSHKLKTEQKNTFKHSICAVSTSMNSDLTDRQHTCISFGTGSFMGQLDMTSSCEILAEE